MQGVLADGGRHLLGLLALELDGQGAVAQRRCQVLGVVAGERPGDLGRRAVAEVVVHGGRRQHPAVEHDRELARRAERGAVVTLLGRGPPGVDTLLAVLEAELHVGLAGARVQHHLGVGHALTGAEGRAELEAVELLVLVLVVVLGQDDGLVGLVIGGRGQRRRPVGVGRGRRGRRRLGGCRRRRGVTRRGRRGGRRRRRCGGRRGRIAPGRDLGEHRAEAQFGRGAHQVERPLLVLHARQRDDDRVALPGDVRLGHTEGVDAVADDPDRLVELVAVDVRLGLEDDRQTSLEVEAEQRAPPRNEDAGHRQHGHRHEGDQ